jgi:hypothetical protein
MSFNEYQKIFSCPKCGTQGAIFLLKIDGSQIIIKQRCPQHGGRKFKIPFVNKNVYIDLISNGIFRCSQCGVRAEAYRVEFKGPWTILICYCPSHKNSVKTQKIWTPLFLEAATLHYQNISYPENNKSSQSNNKNSEVDFTKLEAPKKQKSQIESINTKTPEGEPPKKEILICPDCGKPLEGKEKYCANCGSEVLDM